MKTAWSRLFNSSDTPCTKISLREIDILCPESQFQKVFPARLSVTRVHRDGLPNGNLSYAMTVIPRCLQATWKFQQINELIMNESAAGALWHRLYWKYEILITVNKNPIKSEKQCDTEPLALIPDGRWRWESSQNWDKDGSREERRERRIQMENVWAFS